MAQPYYDGKIYFAYDTNQIILDVNGSKHIMSGGGASGSGIVYANGTEEQIRKESEDDKDTVYFISMDALENAAVEPQKDALILNSDGTMVSTSNNITKKGNWELLGDEEKILKLIYEDKGTTTSEIRNISNEGFMLVQPQPENTIITYKKK